MGTITSGVGLVSGIDTASLIEQLLAVEARGQVTLQSRLSDLQTQKTALLDINARLLNLKNSARRFRIDNLFQQTAATSSDENVLTVSSNTDAQPGSYRFLVRQLASTSQVMTGGFVDADFTPLGLDSLSFEFGRGRIGSDTDLENLNGGSGIDRGRILITTGVGANAVTESIDLSDVTTVGEVVDRINGATNVNVTATISGDGLVIVENAGNKLAIESGTNDTTAEDLGIAQVSPGDTITGTQINTLGTNSALSYLNDGNGVYITDYAADIRITARNGTDLDVDLGRVDLPIDNDTLLADLNNGAGVTLSTDEENPDIRIVLTDGTGIDVDLTGVETVGDLIARIASETDEGSGPRVTAQIVNGSQLELTDVFDPGAGNLTVEGAGTNGDDTAEDLGILGSGVDDVLTGSVLPNLATSAPAQTIGDIIDRINAAATDAGLAITASIGSDGVSLQIDDATGGGGNLTIAATAANSFAAAQLGLEKSVASNTLTGDRIVAGLNSVLTSNLNGGNGATGVLNITDRDGLPTTITNVGDYESVSELVDAINAQAVADGVQITASLNATGNGLRITDTSGGTGNLFVTGAGATALGIETDVAGVAADTVEGTNLQHRYVTASTRLDDLNYGRGVGTGSFTIFDGFGSSSTITLGSNDDTLQDVIARINAAGLNVTARVNDNGDGLLLEHSAPSPQSALRVQTVSGTAARDLNIEGQGEEITSSIDGSYERTVDLALTDTLSDAVGKINDANLPLAATIVNTGSGNTPYRINFASEIAGRRGDLIIDTGGVDIGLQSISAGQDAKVFFGADDPADAIVITSNSNSLDDVVPGVTVDLVNASDDLVTVNVSRDVTGITEGITSFVADFNDAIGRIDQYDFYDIDTEQRGPLLGNPVTSRVRAVLFRQLQASPDSVNSQFQFLSQVGITIGAENVVEFDQNKFLEAYESDPEGVEALFAGFEQATEEAEEISPGVTVGGSEIVTTVAGVGELFDQLLDRLTNSTNGTLTVADDNFQTLIDLTQDRIDAFDERLERKRQQLQSEFLAMERALAQLQGQSNALLGIAGAQQQG